MDSLENRRPSGIMFAAALAGLVAAISLTKTAGYDVWWHLATGRYIADAQRIPFADIFSYTAAGAPWVNHEWLFELIQWILYSKGGAVALTVAKFAIVISTSWLFFRSIAMLTASRTQALWGTVIFLWGLSYRVMDRPHLVGILFLALFLYVLHRHCREGTPLIWILPPLEVIWINCHGSGLMGVELPLAFAAGETVQRFLYRRSWAASPPVPAGRLKGLWVAAALCLVASFANPWGARIILFFREHAQMEAILRYTQEWLPLLNPHLDGIIPPLIYTIALFAALLSFAVNARGARVSHLLITIITSVTLYMGHRFGPEFLLANIPIALFNAKGFVKRVGLKAPRGYAAAWLSIGIVFLISAGAIVYGIPISLRWEMQSEMGIGTKASYAPEAMVDFLDEHDIGGLVLNDMGLGAYLIFRRWPEHRVFVDGRTPVYGDDFYRGFVEAMMNTRGFEAMDEEYHFDYVVLPAYRAWNVKGLHRYLWRNPTWRLVYAEGDGFVYLRKDGANRALIPELELESHPLVELMEQEEAKRRDEESRIGSLK